MTSSTSQFVFMTCRAGAEGAAKVEVVRVEPAWRLSFSRPGFLTFKHAAVRPLDDRRLAERNWTFAHAHGVSLGRVNGETLQSLTQQVWDCDGVARLVEQCSLADIHVWQPDLSLNDDLGSEPSPAPLCRSSKPHCLRRLRPRAKSCVVPRPAGHGPRRGA